MSNLNKIQNVSISRIDKDFLKFLEQDMQNNPQHSQTISSNLVNRAQSLVSNMEVDLNKPLLDEEE